jgi:SAM-dependent methyltransferase
MYTIKINYKGNSSELCEIGKKYGTDKSSQSYTLFYDGLFKNKKNETLSIAEFGILDGASLRMWKEYFVNAEIHGFEYDNYLIDRFKQKCNNNRITLSNIDVTNRYSILSALSEFNVLYDIMIEDTTHLFEDQINVIENAYQYLKPGGILIIEDISKSENDYMNRLAPILDHFQDYYFIELDHVNRNPTGWNNDKLFILIKGGGEPIFKNMNKLTLITPSYRTNNLLKIKNSIQFDYIDEWIIVYDGSKIIDYPHLFDNQENNKIKEYIYKCENGGISGNPQRNYAISKITNPHALIYYLDDDNIIHPDLYKLLNIVDTNKIYTFNQCNRIKGDNINVGRIDTAMAIIPFNLCKNIRWILNHYCADGFYIKECYETNKNAHIYVNNDLCYYNKI